MQNQQTLARHIRVPARLLTVFQKEVFVRVAWVVDDIAWGTSVRISRHIVDLLRGCQFHGCAPSCHPTLVRGIASGTITVVIVRTAVHQVPIAHALTTRVISIIEVGVAKTVRELVTHGTNTGNVAASV